MSETQLLDNGKTTDGIMSIIVYEALKSSALPLSVKQVIALVYIGTGNIISPQTAARLLNNCYTVINQGTGLKCRVAVTKKGATYETTYRVVKSNELET